jgi:hypothetical protein
VDDARPIPCADARNADPADVGVGDGTPKSAAPGNAAPSAAISRQVGGMDGDRWLA